MGPIVKPIHRLGRRCLAVVMLGLICGWIAMGPAPARAAAPEWSAAASLLAPGVGQAINGDVFEGAGRFLPYCPAY